MPEARPSRICVFCGASRGNRPEYLRAAVEVGAALARRGIGLVYGGGAVGLMGALADAVLAGGGEVIGVIPDSLLEREVGHRGLTELRVVDSMHTRKRTMAELASAFVALPGGLGTLEELFEVLTWAQLGIHHKPCALLDVDGFYAPLLALLDHMRDAAFIAPAHRSLLLVERDVDALLDRLAAARAPEFEPVIAEDKT
jgi:uncharacterized protein (TIGR00730 family)